MQAVVSRVQLAQNVCSEPSSRIRLGWSVFPAIRIYQIWSMIIYSTDCVQRTCPARSAGVWLPLQTPERRMLDRTPQGNSDLQYTDFNIMTGSKWNLAHQVESTNTGEIDYYFQQAERRAQQLADLREVTASFARRYIKFSPLREKDLSQRSRTKFMWNISLEYQKFVSNSQFAFIQEAYPLTTSDKLKHLHEQVLIDYEESDKLARKWADSETELSNFEYTIQQREKVLASLVDRMLFLQTEITLPGRGASTATDEVDSQSPSTTASFAEVNPLL